MRSVNMSAINVNGIPADIYPDGFLIGDIVLDYNKNSPDYPAELTQSTALLF